MLTLEKSCGAVILRRGKDGKTEVLLVKMNNGMHYSFPKGHVEKDETEHMTAHREILEETGLSVEFIGDFRGSTRYSPKKGVMKDVIFFLATPSGGELHRQVEEISEALWVPAADALNLVTFDNDKKILSGALSAYEKAEGNM